MTDQSEQQLPTAADVDAAAARLRGVALRTPLISSPVLDALTGGRVFLKAETLQRTGSFKFRGAYNKLSAIAPDARGGGVVAFSSGNHAQGVAAAAKLLSMPAVIVMPADAPRPKRDRTAELGAEVVLYDRAREDRDAVAAALVAERGATLVHAYADPWVIEGQGSSGIEIAAQMERWTGGLPTRVIAPCGGGGLTAGLALACPDAEIVPVEPEGWDDVCRSLEAGEIVPVGPNAPPTACDALQTLATRPVNFAVLKERCRFGLRVTEAEVSAAQRMAFSRLRLVVEPGGAVALAAVLAGKAPLDGRTVVVLSGGNVDPAAFAKVISSAD